MVDTPYLECLGIVRWTALRPIIGIGRGAGPGGLGGGLGGGGVWVREGGDVIYI